MAKDLALGTEPSFWAVARTHRHKETVALGALEAQGFATFCPLTWNVVRRAGRRIERKVPLFPGYVFVAAGDGPGRWRPVNSTRGVRYLLAGRDGRPGRLPAGFVETLGAFTSAQGIFSFRPSLALGQRVRVRSGAFADCVGRIEALDGEGRARLLLNLMSRKVRVTLPADDLQPGG